MSLYFVNAHSSTVWIAVMWYSPFCGEGLPKNCWERQGWFSLAPFGFKKVLPNKAYPNVGDDLADLNRFYGFFAMANDGRRWSGPYKRGVTNSVFHRCDCIGYSHSDFNAGFRLVDIGGNDDFTIKLDP